MNIVLKVSSSNEDYNAGCDFAFVELTAEIAGIALRRIHTLKEQKKLDADIDETYYWSHFVECFFSPWANLASTERDVEAAKPRSGGSAGDAPYRGYRNRHGSGDLQGPAQPSGGCGV